MTKQAQTKLDYQQLLADAIKLEGKLSDCYNMFYTYSFMNQILAMAQVGAQPIATYKRWSELGRQVKRGAKAIELRMPVTIKDKDELDAKGEPVVKTIFMFRRNWFAIDQTEGNTMPAPIKTPHFDETLVLANLGLTKVKFEMPDGNVQGYTNGHDIAINPVAKYPLKTLWHEIGHAVLGHAEARDTGTLTRNQGEVEAEAVAYLLCNVFGYDEPKVYARGYIQSWIDNETISKDSAKNIINAVGKILTANKVAK